MIYLDNAATTKVSQEVLEAMLPYFTEEYGNAGSLHSFGSRAEQAVQTAREQATKPINANPEDIIFTSGGSEANTLAIIVLAEHLKSIGKTHIITTQVEHHSVLECMKSMFYKGFRVTYLPVDRLGRINLDRLSHEICEHTGLVSVMRVNNETGNIYNTHEIGKICHKNDVLFHTDCVQGYCAINTDVVADNIDFLSVSGHKIHAPKGVGFLYAKNRELLTPVILGGSQEHGLRAGTENVPGIVGLGRAAEIASKNMDSMQKKYWKNWVMFLNLLSDNLNNDFVVNGNPYVYSKTVNVRFNDVDGETLLLMLDSAGVAVSAGSACSAHSAVPSHVLTALGLNERQARSSIRVSFSEYTTDEEINEAAKLIADSVKTLRRA